MSRDYQIREGYVVMLKKTIKMGAFYNFVNNFVILVGTILIFAHINILSIFTIPILIKISFIIILTYLKTNLKIDTIKIL